jgi:hypothetical protein
VTVCLIQFELWGFCECLWARRRGGGGEGTTTRAVHLQSLLVPLTIHGTKFSTRLTVKCVVNSLHNCTCGTRTVPYVILVCHSPQVKDTHLCVTMTHTCVCHRKTQRNILRIVSLTGPRNYLTGYKWVWDRECLRSEVTDLSSLGLLSRTGIFLEIQKRIFKRTLTMYDTTTLVQIEEAKFVIRKLPFVTVLAPVRAVGDKGPGWQVSLSCSRCQEYGSCPKKQETSVRLSRVHPTECAWLQELLKRLQDRHVGCAQVVTKQADDDAQAALTVNPDTPNVM